MSSVNLIVNLLLFVIICISSRNSGILEPYQKAYLAFSVIIWLIITLYFIAKLVCMIIVQITRKKYGIKNVDDVFKKFKLCWFFIFGLAFLFMFIGFIYDIALIIKGKIGTIAYPFIYFIVCFAYAILSFFDFIFNEKFIYLILRNLEEKFNGEDNQEIKNSVPKKIKQEDENKEKVKIEDNKSKSE